MTKTRVVLTIGQLERGGAELRLLRLLEDTSLRCDVDIYVYVISGRRGALDSNFLMNNISIIYGKPGFIGLIGFGKFLFNLKPKVAHCNASLAGGLYCLAAWLAGVEIRISHMRTTEDYGSGFLYSIKKPIYKLLLNSFSTDVVGVCDGARNLSATPLKKWTTIYNGIDFSQIKFLQRSKSVGMVKLIVLGRMHHAKNHLFAIDVLNSLITKYKDIKWTLDLYGKENSSIKKEIMERCDYFGLIDQVHFCGSSEEPLMTLSKYDVLLLPSLREGLPGVVLEAGAVGVPSVCSPLPGCYEIARQFSYARIINLTDPDTWADEVFKLSKTDPKFVAQEFSLTDFNFLSHKEKIYKIWQLSS